MSIREDHAAPVPKAVGDRDPPRPGQALHADQGALLLQLRAHLLSREYGANTVRSGGLRVYTTVDRRFQQAAQNAVLRTRPTPDDPAAAIVSINPANGAIRAMTAVTPGKRGNQFNLASQGRRQAGSTFKTFVLAAAIAEGVDPDSTNYTSARSPTSPTRSASRGRSPPTATTTSAPCRSRRRRSPPTTPSTRS